IAPGRGKAFRPVRGGCIRRWICGTEFRCLLVLPAIRGKAGSTRRDFLLGKYSVGYLGFVGFAAGRKIWIGENDGAHAPAVPYFAAIGAADAKRPACSSRVACTIQYQPDGCSNAAILHDGRGERG